MATQIFLNLPVKDLDASIAFFSQLDFKFDPQFTDANATCMIVDKDIFVMLLEEKFFKTFTKKPISDTAKDTEMILGLSVDNRDKVNALVDKAMQAGGKSSNQTQDHGWMYGRSFEDLDGHLWEVFSMDLEARGKH